MKLFTAVLFFVSLCYKPAMAGCKAAGMAEKILLIQVDETGMIKIGRDTVSADKLARHVQERLFKNYMGTGQMQDRIKLEITGSTLPDIIREELVKEIKEGQIKALNELCIQKFRKKFEMLDKRKQERIKKQFPVLFQSEYT